MSQPDFCAIRKSWTLKHWNTVLFAANTETHKKRPEHGLSVHHPAHTYLHGASFIFVFFFLWKYYISKQKFFFYIPRSKLSSLSSQVDRKQKYLLDPKVLLDSLRPSITIHTISSIQISLWRRPNKSNYSNQSNQPTKAINCCEAIWKTLSSNSCSLTMTSHLVCLHICL